MAGHSIGLPDLIVMAVVFGAADAFGGPASLAPIPELIPAELITQANALNSTSAELAINLVGPALGGLAVATLGEATSFGFDAASFALGIGCLVALRWRQNPKSSGGSLLAEAAEGFRYILTRRWLYLLLGGAAVANLVGAVPFLVLLPVLVRHVLHSSPLTLGLVERRRGRGGRLPGSGAGRVSAASSRGDVDGLQSRRTVIGGLVIRPQRLGGGYLQRRLCWLCRLWRRPLLLPAPALGPQEPTRPRLFGVIRDGLDAHPRGHAGGSPGVGARDQDHPAAERDSFRGLWPCAAGARVPLHRGPAVRRVKGLQKAPVEGRTRRRQIRSGHAGRRTTGAVATH